MGDQLQGYWWCPECKQKIWPEEVTYEEYHEVCGTQVIWVHLPDPILETLQAQVEKLKWREETILRWLDDRCCPPEMTGNRCRKRSCGQCFREALDKYALEKG